MAAYSCNGINSRFVDEALLKVLAATVAEQFSHVELYQPEREVLFFLGSDNPLDIWDGAGNAVRALQHTRATITPGHARD